MTTLNTIIEEEKKKIESYDADVIEEEGEASYLVYHIPERDLNSILTTAMQRAYEAGVQKARADWLRSEIEKLEGIAERMSWDLKACSQFPESEPHKYAYDYLLEHYTALTSILTQYTEELLELDGKEV